MSPSKSVPGTPEALISATVPTVFLQPEVIKTSLPSNGTLGWGPVVGLGPLALQGGTSAAGISFLIFNHYTWVWD